MRSKCIISLIFLYYLNDIKASDTLQITHILQRITQFQVKENGAFPKGLFPSYRTYSLNRDRQKADINIFFTGLIVFTLENLKDKLTPYQQELIDDISTNAKSISLKFKNQKGRETYNFWPTDTPKIFPNAGWLNILDKSQSIPDDMDVTVIMLLALKKDSITAASVHQLMQGFTNSKTKKINNTFESIKDLPAYSVWFGKKMPIDFDISVLSNVLYFVQKYNLPFTIADSASIQLMVEVLKEKNHLSNANFISPYYSKPQIILYHLSRLMALKPIPELDLYKVDLINQATRQLQIEKGFMNQVLLSSALLNWGIMPNIITVNQNMSLQDLIEEESFSFFNANVGFMLPKQLKKIISASSVDKFEYYCPAYNNVLLLEYLVLHANYMNGTN